MKIRFLLFIYCFFIILSLNAQVSNGSMDDIVPCGESVEWEIITTGAGTVEITSLPPGVEFENFVSSSCSASVINSSPPIFYTPAACTIKYNVHSTCETYRVRDDLQGGNSNLVFNIGYRWNGNNLQAQDINAEVNAPKLKIEVVDNGAPVSPFVNFKRIIRVCNDGLDSYLDDPIEICFDNEPDILMNSVSLVDGSNIINLPVVSNCVSIVQSQFSTALDRNGLNSGTDSEKLEGGDSSNSSITGECLEIELDLTLNSCASDGEFLQIVSSTWGCNGEECALPINIPISSNISEAIPYLNLTSKLDPGDGCNLDHFMTNTFTIINNGLGGATNIKMHIEPVWNLRSNYGFDLDNILIDDGVNPPYSAAGSLVSPSLFNYAADANFCNSLFTTLGGSTPVVSFDLNIPITLEPGQEVKVIVPIFFCCAINCRESMGYDRWEGSLDYSNSCNNRNFNLPLKIIQSWFHARSRTTPFYNSDIADGETSSVKLDITDFNLDTYYNNRIDWYTNPYWEVQFPCGLSYNGNASVTLKDGSVFNPDILNYDPVTKLLRIEWDHPLVTGNDDNWKGGFIGFDIISDCATCGGGTQNISVTEGYTLGSNCQSSCRGERCYNFPIVVHCGNCSWPGITPLSYDINRINFGQTDLNDDGLPDDGSTANPADILTNRAIVGDTLKGEWYAISANDASHPYWEFAYAGTSMTGMTTRGYANAFKASIKIFDASTGDTLYCDQVPFTQSGYNAANFDFSPSSLCANACFDICNFVYENDDEIWLSAFYEVLDTDICRSALLTPITVSTSMYAAEVANPPANTLPTCSDCDPIVYPDYRWSCDSYTGTWSLLTPFVTMAAGTDVNFSGCEEKWVSNNFYWGIGPGSSYFFNLFPNEYRPFGIWDTVYMSIPTGYEIIDWRIRNLRGTGNGQQNGGSVYAAEYKYSPTPDFVDTTSFKSFSPDPFYGFNMRQYYDDGTLTIPDDGGVSTIYARLRPSCDIEPDVEQDVVYLGTPLWLNNIQECGLFGPRASDRLIFRKPEIIVQSDQPNTAGNGSQAIWPIRVQGLNNNDASHAFLYIPPGTIQVTDVFDSNNNSMPNTKGFYDIGSIAGPSSTNFSIAADYLTCEPDSILVLMGWDCYDHPNSIEDYECELDSLWLKIQPQLPAFDLAIIQPSTVETYDLCSQIPFEFQYRNVGNAYAYDIRSFVFLPQSSAQIDPGSLEIEYPCGSGFQSWASTYPTGFEVPLGTLWSIDITEESIANNNIGPIGDAPNNGWVYPGINETNNCFNIRFEVSTECGFRSSKEYVRTLLTGYGPCGTSGDANGLVSAEIENAAALEINGTDPYEIKLTTDLNATIYACSENQKLDISIEMLGPGTTKPQDSIEIRLPTGISYVSNDANLVGSEYNVTGLNSVSFPIQPALNVGDILDFSVNLSLDKDSLTCGPNTMTVKTFTIEQVQCITAPPGQLCDVYSTTSFNDINFDVEKPDLGININTAYAPCSTNGDLVVTYELELSNRSSINIAAGEQFPIELFANEDGSCSIFGQNQLLEIVTFTGPLTAGSTTLLTGTFNVPFEICDMIAKIEGCVCEDEGFDCTTIDIVDLPNNTYSTCYPNNVQIETCDRNEFIYEWKAIPPAFDFWIEGPNDIYNPTIAVPDPGLLNQTFYFEVTIDRGRGCRSRDLVAVTVSPEIEYDAGEDFYVCGTETILNGSITGAVGIWEHISGPGNPIIEDPNDPTSSVIDLENGTHVFEWTVIAQDGCNNGNNDQVTVDVVSPAEVTVNTDCRIENGNSVYYYTIFVAATGLPGTYSITGNDFRDNLSYNTTYGPYGPIPIDNSTLNLIINNDLGHCDPVRSDREVLCPKFDFGDLPDTDANLGPLNYNTLNANNGPSHQIVPGLIIKDYIDDEGDALESPDALGDGDDEDGFFFMSYLEAIKGATYKLPLRITNTTAQIAHLEIWIDWNGDGDFIDADEFVYDMADNAAGDFGTTVLNLDIPDHAAENIPLGFRARLSHQDNMTPYGLVSSGEVEDYLFRVIVNDDVCLPLLISIED